MCWKDVGIFLSRDLFFHSEPPFSRANKRRPLGSAGSLVWCTHLHVGAQVPNRPTLVPTYLPR